MIIRTKRIEARRLSAEDEQEIGRLLSDPKVMEFSFAAPMNQSTSRSYLQSAIDSYDRFGYGIYALINISDGALMGYSGFTHYSDLDSQEEVELGYRLFPQYWGLGLATEAASALLNYGHNDLGFKRIISLIREDNEASIKVSKKIGAVIEKSLTLNGYTSLVYVYNKNN